MATVESKSEEERGKSGNDEFRTDAFYTDDSQTDCIDLVDSEEEVDDPTFDVLEETRSRLSKISLKKSRPSHCKKKDVNSDNDNEGVQMIEVPQLSEDDEKFFEKLETMIKDGQEKKLKVDQCKTYLRKHGLRLTGTKDVLIRRIEEYLEVIDGEGEKKYPESSFVINCQGDSCMGDVLMFEQNVYEMFSIASRSATGPSLGTKTVAGRVVKESYGSAKQQHTFTIEVLWNKGVNPFPPLHPLLIKGRNLYKLKTLRQKWPDEGDRRKVLQEKHTRGSIARCSRDIRANAKKTWMMNKRGGRRDNNNGMSKTSIIAPQGVPQSQPQPIMPIQQPQQQPNHMVSTANKHVNSSFISEKPISGGEQATCKFQNRRDVHHNTITYPQDAHKLNIRSSQVIMSRGQNHKKSSNGLGGRLNDPYPRSPSFQKQHSTSGLVSGRLNDPYPRSPPFQKHQSISGFVGGRLNNPYPRSPSFKNQQGSNGFIGGRLPFKDLTRVQHSTDGFWGNYDLNNGYTNGILNRPLKFCFYYRQGRCRYNDNCKFLHE